MNKMTDEKMVELFNEGECAYIDFYKDEKNTTTIFANFGITLKCDYSWNEKVLQIKRNGITIGYVFYDEMIMKGY